MLRLALGFVILFILGCSLERSHNFPPVPLGLDSLHDVGGVPKVRRIFRKGVSYLYRADYYDKDNQIITSDYVKISGTGERWSMQPELQDVIQLAFGYSEEDKLKIEADPINKTSNLQWNTTTTEGIIENEDRVWIHPIRHNQYIFTEVAPFPEIELPASIKKNMERIYFYPRWLGRLGFHDCFF